MVSKESLVTFVMEWQQVVKMWEILTFQGLILKYFCQKYILTRNSRLICHKKYKIQFWHFSYKSQEKVYSIKMCPKFVGSPSFHFKIYQRILWNSPLLGKSQLYFVSLNLKLHNRYHHNHGKKLRDLHASSVFIILKNNVSQSFSTVAMWVIVIKKILKIGFFREVLQNSN